MAGCDPVVTERIELDAPPDRVLELLRRAEAYPRWVIGTRRVVAVDPSWPTDGSTFTHEFGVWPLRGRDRTKVVRFDDPTGTVTLEARGRPAGRAMVLLQVTERDAGSVLSLTEGPLDGPARLVPSIVTAPLLSLRNKRSLRRFRRLVGG
jgi:hypothetical protein